MKTKFLTLLSLFIFAGNLSQAADTRIITLTTAEPHCEIRLTENANATVGGPGDQTIQLSRQEFKSIVSYDYSYAYDLLAAPADRGGFEISVSSAEEESEVTFQVLHTYPNFPPNMTDVPKNIPEGLKALAIVRMSKLAGGKVAPTSQTFDLDGLIRFEKLFGVPYISRIDLVCR